jgi:hypothetical protein
MKNLQKLVMKRHSLIFFIPVFLMLFFFSSSSVAQIYEPEGLNMPGGWNDWTNPPTNLALASSTQVTGGRVVKIATGTTRWQTIFNAAASGGDVVGGSFEWLFTSGSTGNPWGNKWGGVSVAMNSLQAYTKGGANNNITLTNGKWYTMNWKDIGYVSTDAIFMETSAEPVNILTVTFPAQGSVNIPVTVNVTVSNSLCPEENVYLRYTTDSWATSTVLPVTISGTTGSAVIPGQPDGTTVSYYAFSSTLTGITGNFDMLSIKINNNGGTNYSYLVGAPPISWANLQGPAIGTINPGQTLDVFSQVHIAGATGQPTPAPGVQAWIGYNNSNTNPNTWTNWIAATYTGPSGTNDEYKGIIGATLVPGTYYYASRFRLGSGSYVYGGYNSGYWDGTTNVSGILTVNGAAPTVTTAAVSAITNLSAGSGGNVIADGGSSVTARGVCWSTSPNPTIADSKTVNGSGTGPYTSAITPLTPGTIYHVRAYATNSTDTGYGSDLQFTTYYTVTFNVDMATANGFIAGTDVVYIAGNFPGAYWYEPGSSSTLLFSRVGSSLTYTLSLPLPAGTYEYKHFKNAGWSGGEWIDGNRFVTISGNTTLNNTWKGDINWANLQSPGTGAINPGGTYDVYAQAYIPNGVTAAADSAFGLKAWIGYSTGNTNPGTWINWVPAPFFGQAYDNDEFKANLGAAIGSTGIYYYASRFQFGNGAYIYGGFSGTGGGFWDGTANISGVLTVTAANKTLNLTSVLLEGLYNGGGTMHQAADELGGPHFTAPTADQITVELHSAANYASILYTFPAVNLSTTGTATVAIPSTISGSYFITVKHRNSVETTSAAAVSFAAATINQSFGLAGVFAGNLGLTIDGYYAIYTGDVNQDGAIDSGDFTPVDNDASNYVSGYLATDINGDGAIDSGDFTSIDNNGLNYIGSAHP